MQNPKREPKGRIEKFEIWSEFIEALDKTYTTSFKDACKILRASRGWVNQYVKPFVRSVYISNNRRGDIRTGKINWVALAAIQLKRPNMTESIWFHTDDFQAYLTDHVISCTKQTKRIPMTYLMPIDQVEEFVRQRVEITEKLRHAKFPFEISKLSAQYAMLPELFYRDDPVTQRLLEHEVKVTERTKVPAISVPLPNNYIEYWDALHDMKDYGDADETLYRHLFRNGYIRIELQLPDLKGKVGKKIFYVPDPFPIRNRYDDHGTITVTEEAWQEYQKSQQS